MLPVKITDARGMLQEVEGAGDLAYLRGTYSMNLQIERFLAGFLQESGLFVYGRVARRGCRWVDVAVDKQGLDRISVPPSYIR